MKESILLFTGSYIDFEIIPSIKKGIKEYLGNRMISDDCPDYPMLKINQSLVSEDISNICKMISDTKGDISLLYITSESEEESQMLSKLIIELKPVT